MVARHASLVVMAFLITACGERNVGASATAGQSSASNESLSTKRSKALSVAREQASTVNIPAAKAIFEALRVEPTVSIEPPSAFELGLRNQLAGKARQETLTADEAALWSGLAASAAMRVRALTTVAMEPMVTWPIEPFDMRHGTFLPAAQRWAADRYAAAELANDVATQIASRLAIAPISGADAAQRQVLQVFATLDYDALLAQYEKSRKSVSIRTGDGQQVRFVLSNGDDVKIDAAGPQITRNRNPWFSNDVLSGNSYQFAIASSASATSSKSKDVAQDIAAGSSQTNDATATVK